jgi:hypothetical protein
MGAIETKRCAMREIRSFVVRLYRRDGQGVAGVVEDVQTGCVHTFHTADDLWLVLSARTRDPNQERKSR